MCPPPATGSHPHTSTERNNAHANTKPDAAHADRTPVLIQWVWQIKRLPKVLVTPRTAWPPQYDLKEIAMGRHHSTHPPASTFNPEQKLAYEYLQLSAQNLTDSTERRLYWIQLARDYGLPWSQIGNALGISDTAARRLHQRNNGAVTHG